MGILKLSKRPNSRLNADLPEMLTEKHMPSKHNNLDVISNQSSLMSQMLEDRINDSLIRMKQKNIKSLANLGNFYAKSSSVMKERARGALNNKTKTWVPAKSNKSPVRSVKSPSKPRLNNSIDKFKTLEE